MLYCPRDRLSVEHGYSINMMSVHFCLWLLPDCIMLKELQVKIAEANSCFMWQSGTSAQQPNITKLFSTTGYWLIFTYANKPFHIGTVYVISIWSLSMLGFCLVPVSQCHIDSTAGSSSVNLSLPLMSCTSLSQCWEQPMILPVQPVLILPT